ncbi:MAG: zinc-finger domain-containing protein [Alphaproteobacteria bacterium]|nr:zinc-finger domain-containing protein [Alphaproteobacteria bacterium]
MADGATPRFHNSDGLSHIEIGARKFECIGALPPHDHPHVFLDMGGENEIVCPYCSTHFIHTSARPDTVSLPADAANPPAARYDPPSP